MQPMVNTPAGASTASPEDPLAGHPKYVKVCDLNSGAFGKVVLALERQTQQQVAVKFIARGSSVTKYVEGEVQLLRRFNHPHIVQFMEVFLTDRYLAIAMEFMEGGNMYEYILSRKQRLPEEEARWFFQQLICAVDYCHKLGIANRDIKLENTLLDSPLQKALQASQRPPLLKICDFGYSKDERVQSMPKSRVGTMDYIAPEVVLNIKGAHYDGKAADVWAVGVMLYAMVTLQYPFRRPQDEALQPEMQGSAVLKRIVKCEYELPTYLSPSCVDLLQRCLEKDPRKRLTIQGIQQHPWFSLNLPNGAGDMNDELINNERYNKGSPACLQSLQQICATIREAQAPLPPVLPPTNSMRAAELYMLDDDDLQVLDRIRSGDGVAQQQAAFAAGPGVSGAAMMSCFSLCDPSMLPSLDLEALGIELPQMEEQQQQFFPPGQ